MKIEVTTVFPHIAAAYVLELNTFCGFVSKKILSLIGKNNCDHRYIPLRRPGMHCFDDFYMSIGMNKFFNKQLRCQWL